MESCLKSRRHMCCVDLIFELDVGPWMKRDQKDALLRPGRKKGVARYYYLFFSRFAWVCCGSWNHDHRHSE